MSYLATAEGLEHVLGFALPGDTLRILDVDGGDVVREEQDLVGVELVGVLAGQVVLRDESALQESDDEGAGAGEAVEDVYALAGQSLPELLAQDLVDGAEDEVDDLDGGVDDAEPVDGLLERGGEELVVELDDDTLLACRVGHALHSAAHGAVELLELLVLGLERVFVEAGQHQLHGLGDRVVGGEVVVGEEGLEYRARDKVLGEHLDRLVGGDGLVEVAAQALEELVELLRCG